jgi:anhydro-N-acetylmuramic acid kinase
VTDAAEFYLGLISGTSADGVDVALVSFAPAAKLHAGLTHPYPAAIRAQILQLSQADGLVAMDALGDLDGQIAEVFAQAALTLLDRNGVAVGAVRALGSHGQTIRHSPTRKPPSTWQLGDPNRIAERTGILTVADFRRRDLAAGGQGAPLLPAFHAALWAGAGSTQVVLNLGGIANITILPGDSSLPVSGFDTGPANCLLDAWTERHLSAPCDRNGAFAATGKLDDQLLGRMLSDPYFLRPPPKSSGRETFHLAWLQSHIGDSALTPADVQATLVELTTRSIAQAIDRHAADTARVLVCGGGVHNDFLLRSLQIALSPISVESTSTCGVDPDYIEAMAFAWLARERLDGRPGNLPAVTGARHARVLGAIYSGS